MLSWDGGWFGPTLDVTVYFRHVGGLGDGADVVVAGQVIGEVAAIERVPARAARAADHPLHPDGGAAVRLRIDPARADHGAPNGEVVVAARGLIGEPYLAFGPPGDGSAPSRPLAEGDRLRGIDPVPPEQLVLRGFESTAAFRALLVELAPAAAALREAAGRVELELAAIAPDGGFGRLGRAIGDVRREAERLAGILRAAGGPPAGPTLAAALATGRRLFAALDRLAPAARDLGAELSRVRTRLPADLGADLDRALADVAAAALAFAAIRADAAAIGADLEDGRGTVGALLNDPEFSDDARRLGKILKRQPWRVLGRDPDRPRSASDD